ncbi:MAG TPA: hypothetical protein VNM46_17780 [Xanthobacteraceae bacterium]|nr:hypothetical protein [Xanthobacteraceae bacterium]
MKFARYACIFAAVFALASSAAVKSAAAQDQYKPQIDALRKAMEKYRDYKVAIRDLYLSTVGCVHYAGEKIPDHMVYAKGAMGVHFVNLTVKGPPDPLKPNVLIYEPVGKNLRLVAVEWLVPHSPDVKEAPSLFGQKFMGPMEGHEPLIPKEFVHYDLHAWLFKDNPLGMFEATNPKVSCKGYPQALLEKPTKMVHDHGKTAQGN